jgi:hypothetical protein
MPVQMESFQQAWANLSSPGLELTRASFDVGWEVATSGAKNALTISAILAAAASAAGIFHVSRTQITSVLGDIWGMIEPPMLEGS